MDSPMATPDLLSPMILLTPTLPSWVIPMVNTTLALLLLLLLARCLLSQVVAMATPVLTRLPPSVPPLCQLTRVASCHLTSEDNNSFLGVVHPLPWQLRTVQHQGHHLAQAQCWRER